MIFSIQPNAGRELIAIINNVGKLNTDYVISRDCKPNHVPIGTIEYCESVLNLKTNNKIKNFYPKFLKDYIKRKIEIVQFPNELNLSNKFVKLATSWKSEIKSEVKSCLSDIPKGTYFVSDIVSIVEEWRYYILRGEVVTSGWYSGTNEEEPAPELNIEYPDSFSGAVDFARTKDGEYILVEAHAPYACGWYGENGYDYAYWMLNAWPSYLENKSFWDLLNERERDQLN